MSGSWEMFEKSFMRTQRLWLQSYTLSTFVGVSPIEWELDKYSTELCAYDTEPEHSIESQRNHVLQVRLKKGYNYEGQSVVEFNNLFAGLFASKKAPLKTET